MVHKEKLTAPTITTSKQNYGKVSAFQKDIIHYAHQWATVDFEGDGKIAATYMKLPADFETQKIKMETKGWARKKQPTKVTISFDIKNSIADLFNMKPRLSPAQAFDKLKNMELYTNNHFVQHIMNEARVHSQFSQLMKKRKDLKMNANARIEFGREPCVQMGTCTTYKGLSDPHDLRFEIHRRKLNVSVEGKNQQALIQILINNDQDELEGYPEEDDIDIAYDADQNVEFLLDPPDLETDIEGREDDEVPNLDDPDSLNGFLEELQARPNK
jgi:hypothetical protein